MSLVLVGACPLCFQAQPYNLGCTVPPRTARGRAALLFLELGPGVSRDPLSYSVVPFNFHRLFLGSSPSTPGSRLGRLPLVSCAASS